MDHTGACPRLSANLGLLVNSSVPTVSILLSSGEWCAKCGDETTMAVVGPLIMAILHS